MARRALESLRELMASSSHYLCLPGRCNCECEEQHGWVKDPTDPHARERAIETARHDPPPGPLSGHGGRRSPGSVGFDQRHLPGLPYAGRIGSYLESSTNVTGVPLDTRSATRSASQFVSRTQPCDSDLETRPGMGCRGCHSLHRKDLSTSCRRDCSGPA